MPIFFVRSALGIICLWLFAASSWALAQPVTISGEVAALNGRSCRAYLHVDLAAELPPLALSLQGTGIYTMAKAHAIDPALRRLVAAKRLAVVTFDKPGIHDDTSLGAMRVDDAVYNRYTQEDLLACTARARRWAENISPVALAPALYLSGHSEGAQVLTRYYRELIVSDPAEADGVKMLLLSGLPMDDWRAMLDGQLSEENKKQFWRGFAQRSDVVLRAFGGLTHAYLAHVFRQEPLRQTLESLWAAQVKARLHIFQGLRDSNTPAAAVKDFESQNRARKERGESALDLYVRYYDAGHALNARAVEDIVTDLESYLSQDAASSKVPADAGTKDAHANSAATRPSWHDGDQQNGILPGKATHEKMPPARSLATAA